MSLLYKLGLYARKECMTRYPDKVILKEDKRVYLERWHVIPRNRFLNIYLHHFCASDDDRALHDHPWLFNCSVVLKGAYDEIVPMKGSKYQTLRLYRDEGDVVWRWGKSIHRVKLFGQVHLKYEKPCWTLFITGPVVREWGFHCPNGWRSWKVFGQTSNGVSTVTRGCD